MVVDRTDRERMGSGSARVEQRSDGSIAGTAFDPDRYEVVACIVDGDDGVQPIASAVGRRRDGDDRRGNDGVGDGLLADVEGVVPGADGEGVRSERGCVECRPGGLVAGAEVDPGAAWVAA